MRGNYVPHNNNSLLDGFTAQATALLRCPVQPVLVRLAIERSRQEEIEMLFALLCAAMATAPLTGKPETVRIATFNIWELNAEKLKQENSIRYRIESPIT